MDAAQGGLYVDFGVGGDGAGVDAQEFAVSARDQPADGSPHCEVAGVLAVVGHEGGDLGAQRPERWRLGVGVQSSHREVPR